MMVPVIDLQRKPLMPTTPSRARRWIKEKKATPYWQKGIFCVRLNVEPSSRELQAVAVGIDPGSKKEGFTVKSAKHTYLNIQADTVYWVKATMELRRNMRRSRRNRKTPYRKHRLNRSHGGLPPSTRARWDWKLRISRHLAKMYPISNFVVEDIKATTSGKSKRWNQSFSPLEIGKNWFYSELSKIAPVELKLGWQTAELRKTCGLEKSLDKMSNDFSAHCVDSWVLAWSCVGGSQTPNKDVLCIVPIRFHRRQLHKFQPAQFGIRSQYGSTRSLGFTRGSVVTHQRYYTEIKGVRKFTDLYVGGHTAKRLSLHSVKNGKRVSRSVKPSDCRFRTYSSWRWH